MASQSSTPISQPHEEGVLIEFGTPENKFYLRIKTIKGMVEFTVIVEDGRIKAWKPMAFEYVAPNA